MNYAIIMDLGPDPRMYLEMGYGKFDYRKVGDKAVWRFDTEAGRTKFKKDFAKFNPSDCDPSIGYEPQYPSPDFSGWVF